MSVEPGRGFGVFVVGQVVLMAVILALVVDELFLGAGSLTTADVGLLAIVLAVGGVFVFAPLWVYYDVYRRGDDRKWVLVVFLPVINVFGLAAYLHHRRNDPT